MRRTRTLALLIFLFLPVWSVPATRLQFEITNNTQPASGRLLIIIAKSNRPEPRMRFGETGMDAPPILARDVKNLGPESAATLDSSAAIFPIPNLDALASGDYYVQAVLDSNLDSAAMNAPGNRYSEPQLVHLDPRDGGIVKLALTNTVPPEQLPPDDDYVRFVKIQSNLLTQFHKRPIYLRAGIIVPKDYGTTDRRWPLRISIGGYGTRYSVVGRMMSSNSEFRRMWM